MTAQPTDGRTRRRLAAMHRVQDAAMRLFERQGYDAVTVEAVARAAKVGAASVYRNFGTKEQLVLWDEYDPRLLDGLEAGLGSLPPLEALREAVGAGLRGFSPAERRRLLRRTALVMRTPALAAASRQGLEVLGGQLDARLRRAVPSPLERAVLCAVFTAALQVAVERWWRGGGRRPLAAVLDQALRAVSAL